MFPNRPKPGETEDDLLKLQEEFFKNKAENKMQPSAKLIQEQHNKQKSETAKVSEPEEMNVDVHEHLSNTFEDIPNNPRINNIQEKVQIQPPTSVSVSRSLHGFPKAKRRDLSLTPSASGGSIFAKQMKKQRLESEQSSGSIFVGQLTIKEKIEGKSTTDNKDQPVKNIPPQSYILTGSDKEELHKENVHKLFEMTEEEILEERQNLIETMDPALIAFLKSRRSNTPQKAENKIPSMAEQMRMGDDVKLEELETPMEILNQPDSDRWLNFDVVESSKLAWMKTIKPASIEKDKPYEARFDFEGNILPYVEEEINEKNRILYHHGDEPGRPGYTLQELFQLARSSVNQQKIIALNTIANILSLDSLGLYDGIIELPIEQIFFVLRFCMDDNTPSVLNSCVKALRNLFVYSIDETCLDATSTFIVGLVQPCLAIEPDEYEDDPTVNDQQLAEQNLIKCLLRSDILVRLRYIMNIVQPPIETNVYILDILTRISRDSNYSCMKLYKFDNLVDSILKKFVFIDYKPSLSWDSAPLPEAFRFLQVLCNKNVCYARDLVMQKNIMNSIANILSNIHVSVNPNGLKLQVQVMHLWTVFTKYGLGTDYFKILQPILVQMFNHHLNNTDLIPQTSYLMQSHLSSLLILLMEGYKKQLDTVFPEHLIMDGFAKWSAQLTLLETYTCGKLQIISSISLCIAALQQYDHKMTFNIDKVHYCIENILQSNSFTKITSNLARSSNILNKNQSKKPSSNLLSLEAAVWESSDHVVPVLQIKSCLPFISSLSSLILTINEPTLKVKFLKSTHLAQYVGEIQKCKKFNLLTNWFTRIESKLVMNLLKIAVSVRELLEIEASSFFYETTIKTLGIFTTEQKADIEFVLENVVFNQAFFPTDVLMQNLSLEYDKDYLKAAFQSLKDIFSLYKKVLGLKSGDTSSLCNNYSSAPTKIVVPIDWIYSPIILLYSEQQQNKVTAPEDIQLNNILICLIWIYFYEHYFSNLAELINPTDRYCRLSCVFLSKDDLFLNEDISSLLKLCFKCVLKRGLDTINFNKPIQGLNNFQDFYVQLLEQYQGVSYGNALFGNYILLPLLQRYDVKWRKILWSEYAGVVQIFNIKRDQLLLDFNEFLTPEETDVSLLKCYKRCIDSNIARKGFVLHEIAKVHVDNYVQKYIRKK